MPKDLPVSKRVKRHVIGRPQRFFVAVPPPLARLCADELRALLGPERPLRRRPGGIEFTGRLIEGWRVNLSSRFANRVLMELQAFRAADFGRLEKKVGDFPWELYLYADSPLAARAATRHCRLYHSDAVAQRVLAQVAGRLAAAGQPSPPERPADAPQRLFVRGRDDRFTVSLDASGEHLHKRGIKTHGGKAPLRENLAAAVLTLAAWDGRQPLVDPMCGSGTFSVEAAMLAAGLPAGWFRQFAFMQWPSFVPRRWEHLRRESAPAAGPRPGRILAADVDAGACRRLERCLQAHGLAGVVEVACTDFFSLAPPEGPEKGVVVLNPPYGRRLARVAGAQGLGAIVSRLKTAWQGWRLALVAPPAQLAAAGDLNLRTRRLTHGGLTVVVGVGEIG